MSLKVCCLLSICAVSGEVNALFDHIDFDDQLEIKNTSIVLLKQGALLMNIGALNYVVNTIKYLVQMESRSQ